MSEHKNISLKPQHIFIAGMIVIPSFLFQSSLILKWIQVALFILLSAFSGKRVRILPNLIITTGIIFANLLTPIGKILFSILGFHITSGAILNGLERASVLIGMIYISRSIVRKDLMLPGKIGNLLSLVFFYFEKIMVGKRLSKKNLIKQIDEKIIQVYHSSEEFSLNDISIGRKFAYSSPSGLLCLALLILVNWTLFTLPFFYNLY